MAAAPTLVLTLVLALFLQGCSGRPADQGGGQREGGAVGVESPGAGEDRLGGVVRDPPRRIEGVRVPAYGSEGARQDFDFRPTSGTFLLVAFGYTSCPDVCPATLVTLRGALAELGELSPSVEVAFVTVDPQRDTPEKLRAYLDHFFKGGRYWAVVGEGDSLEDAKSAFGVRAVRQDYPETGDYGFSHTATVYAVDRQGSVVIEWPFGTDSKTIASDLRVLAGKRSSTGGAR